MKRKRKKYCVNLIKIPKFKLKQKIFAFFIILIILIYSYAKYLATPVIVANTETQISSYATKSVNYAIAQTMNQGTNYGDLVTIVRDDAQTVSYIEANSVRINLLSKTMSRVVMNNFLKLAETPITISLGSFSGLSILSGYGPKIAYNVNPVGEVNCFFSSKFESAGINQTNHKIYLMIKINISVVFPFKKLSIENSSDVLLCETLIVGKIPEVYLNSNNLTDMLNLVPEKFNSWQKYCIVS